MKLNLLNKNLGKELHFHNLGLKIKSLQAAFLLNEKYQKLDAPEPGFCCIGITDSCFFKCQMCDKWKTDLSVDERFSKPPSLEQWKKFIYQLSNVVPHRLKGVIDERFEINFAGGEALTHPHTLPLIKYASSLGFRTVIASNGFLINKNMAKKLHESGLSALNLSLDSLNPKIHDEFRGFKGAYDGVMQAIEALNPYKYPQVGIISIIHGSTYKGIIDLVNWANKHNKLNWILTMAIMQPNNTIFESGWYEKDDFEFLWPEDASEVVKVIDDLIKIKKQQIKLTKAGLRKSETLVNTLPQLYAFKNYFQFPEKFVKNERSCNFDTAIQVSAVGDIYMCYHYTKLGNVRKDDFRKLWGSEKTKKIREKIKVCKTNCHELINCYYKDEYPFNLSE